MKIKLIIPATMLIIGCSTPPATPPRHASVLKHPVPHASFEPEYDFAGHWSSGSEEYTDTHRHGKHVVSTYNTIAGYDHVFEGDYVDDHTIKGIQTRRKRSDSTTTRMRLTITLLSPDSGQVDWIVLDSNSDLTKGQTGLVVIHRVHPALH